MTDEKPEFVYTRIQEGVRTVESDREWVKGAFAAHVDGLAIMEHFAKRDGVATWTVQGGNTHAKPITYEVRPNG